jgi:hypothetical protein
VLVGVTSVWREKSVTVHFSAAPSLIASHVIVKSPDGLEGPAELRAPLWVALINKWVWNFNDGKES